ncbi:uncharacterized protein LOC132725410 isoform X1 [Ruditapes philippinarum]|uniref:uncharacterized protein LOC132725410 isoform X1 n=1 Tax=Ruditapes philippinarum TaxID=129788 RepID=UPI00295BE8DC|nr:uncharacterized protein LOC132725410 isoform X1 [Ruditapes philippinarum]XP_060566514.1 uncharacterized protein LOC132725410 isoform X1 [Ruditapes philippinarum]XP_060566515.1 uncharacterized protein LOC132725410 isoform X1 [Ruditapes philippinarum]XP_060566516.1 uncharacterized protein LOC132725410 isoform X1 [Ruditapes philippinarum]
MDRLRRKKILTIVFSCFIPCGVAIWHNQQKRFDGEILPKDPNLCTTQSITFTGVLKDDPVTNYSIGFTYKSRDTNGKFVTVDRNNVTYINETIAEYTVPNIPPLTDLKIKQYMHVNSYYWQVFGDNNKTLQLGETTTALIFPMPEEVRDFDCIVSNYETMICSWSYGTDYGSFMPEVIFQWRNPVYSKTWTECKYLNIQDGYCTWNETKAGYFKTSNITIRLTLKQRCNINVTSVFHIDTSKIVKPNPVSSIRSNVINSTCISLLWETTNSEQFYPKEHLITLSSLGGPVTNNTLITTRDTEKLEHEQTFCDMHPYTNYSFNVRVRPTGLFSGYFSDTVEHTSTTYSDIPSASPQVIKGGYRLDHRECEDGIERRRVCMFWKPIKFEDRNGPMKGLVGEFTALPPAIHKVKENWTKDEMYGCSTILCNTGYIFTIKARNINGTSKQGSSVSIPAKGKPIMYFIFFISMLICCKFVEKYIYHITRSQVYDCVFYSPSV